MVNLTGMTTESRNENTMELDKMSAIEIATVMNKEDENVPKAIKEVLPQIAGAIDMIALAFSNGGRLIYSGAGTSGRLGLLDAVECPPTFGVNPEMVTGLIAGGKDAFIKAAEGAEDSKEMGVSDLKAINLNSKDVFVGIAASGRTPYVIGGIEYAKSLGCKTAVISCNKGSSLGKLADIAIEVTVGPEVLTGSTRLKSGTAQKMILNMLSTGAMVKVGKAYQNLMVDVMQTNEKLHVRARNIVMTATGADEKTATDKIKEADGSVKLAIVMILLECNKNEAVNKIKNANGHIRKAVEK